MRARRSRGGTINKIVCLADKSDLWSPVALLTKKLLYVLNRQSRQRVKPLCLGFVLLVLTGWGVGSPREVPCSSESTSACSPKTAALEDFLLNLPPECGFLALQLGIKMERRKETNNKTATRQMEDTQNIS